MPSITEFPSSAYTDLLTGWPWNAPENVFAVDAETAFMLADADEFILDTLHAHDFGFALAADAVIEGIEVTFHDQTTVLGIASGSIHLSLNDSNLSSGSFVYSQTEGDFTYGTPTFLWGYDELFGSDVNSINFAVLFAPIGDAFADLEFHIDAISVTVYYSGGTPTQKIRPAAVVTSAWTPSGAATSWEAIDEETLDTGDFAISPDATAGGHEEKVRLESASRPSGDTGFAVKFSHDKQYQGGDTVNLIVNLYRADGTTLVATTTINNIGTTVLGTLTVTEAEAANLTESDFTTGIVIGYKEVKA